MTKLETSAKKYDIPGESGGFWEQTNGPHIAGPCYTQEIRQTLHPVSSPLDAANFIIRSSSPLLLRRLGDVHRGGGFLRREVKSAFGGL